MTQPEQTRLSYQTKRTLGYVDIFGGLGVLNRKAYYQTKQGTPLGVFGTITIPEQKNSDGLHFRALPNNWTIRNSIVMFWHKRKQQLKNNGHKISDLPRYGRELRLAMDARHSSLWEGGSTDHLAPRNDLGGFVLTKQELIGSHDSVSLVNGQMWEQTKIAAPNLAEKVDLVSGVVDDIPTYDIGVLGNTDISTQYAGIVEEYLVKRVNPVGDQDSEDDGLPDSTAGVMDVSLYDRMTSVNEEHIDEILQAVEDVGDMRPYNMTDIHELLPVGYTELNSSSNSFDFFAPLGLLEVMTVDHQANTDPAVTTFDTNFIIDVHAIVEM